ncbi:lipocalin family protein [Mucilaginibacter sp. OK098]|uniref:lipocalin family protein n=1 Tax=Mucilaginibacter sp. OK098 TaxID=1855297 RepID=UPI0009193110|nr:lipocalin family protein [Mucilaginibacter sp. OK098]SHN02113.1 Lipocalin-like domain-containing protein [Mucilaginibacter sp. OK098]
MKKNLLLLVLFLTSIFSSCKKDTASKPTISIAGKWHWVEQTYDSYTNDKLTSHEDYTTILDPLSYFEFDADGTFIENPQDRNTQFNYGKYHITDNVLYIKRDIDTEEWHYTIKKLTSSSLIIHSTSGEAPYRGETEYTMKR